MKHGGGLVMVEIIKNTSTCSLNVRERKCVLAVVILRKGGIYWMEGGYASGEER